MDIENGRVAIVSQVSSALWIGSFILKMGDFRKRQYLLFPVWRSAWGNAGLGGEIIYCNIEGVSWFGLHEIVVVSDKKMRNQDKWCNHKEEMIHIFEIPHR